MSGDTLVLNADFMPVSVLPISTMIWQDAVKAMWLDHVQVIEHYDDWIVRSPSVSMPVPSIVMTKRYIKVGVGVRLSSENVKLRDGYRCQYCGERFVEDELTMDHVHPRSKGGRDAWDNLVAACRPCNHGRGADVRIRPMIKPYKPTYYEMVDRRREFPVVVPCQKWITYLDWPEDNVVVKKRKRSLNRSATFHFEQLAAA